MEDKLVILAEQPYERALLIQTRLKNEGIDSILSNVNLIQPDASTGVQLKVREEDLEKAIDIYKNFLHDEGEGIKKSSEIQEEKKSGVRKILVPVDFSEYSRHAAHFAIYYASKVKAEILFLNAYYSPDLQTIPYDESFGIEGSLASDLNELRNAAKKEIKKFVAGLRKTAEEEKLKNLLLDYSVVEGSLDDAVFFACESYQPDMIVMGARGKNKRKSDPIGSKTTRIMEKSSVPVLVIPEDTDLQGFFDRKKILYATDYDEADFEAISKMVNLIKPFNMEIICTHVGTERANPWEKVKMDGLKEYFKKSYPELKLQCNIITHEDVITGLDEYISKNPVSALALTTHKRNLIAKLFNPSLTRKIFFYTTVPLLVFHT